VQEDDSDDSQHLNKCQLVYQWEPEKNSRDKISPNHQYNESGDDSDQEEVKIEKIRPIMDTKIIYKSYEISRSQ
jgi:hypothetical protein